MIIKPGVVIRKGFQSLERILIRFNTLTLEGAICISSESNDLIAVIVPFICNEESWIPIREIRENSMRGSPSSSEFCVEAAMRIALYFNISC